MLLFIVTNKIRIYFNTIFLHYNKKICDPSAYGKATLSREKLRFISTALALNHPETAEGMLFRFVVRAAAVLRWFVVFYECSVFQKEVLVILANW